ncbi:MAG: DNA polymerase IV [Chitinophagaceae bacterium]|nr:MAG: DNA polymerase IV [Chitinophagaceae bacterium]
MSDSIPHIVHFDLDSFFVSVEILLNSDLRGKPVIVGGSAQRGVVSTCSYEARKFGVQSAMPMAKAMQLCPQAIVLKGSFEAYSKYSRMVTDIIADKVPIFQKASIDEFYCDLSGMDKFFGASKYAQALRKTIMDETGLPISGGMGSAKFIAKLATNEAKPNGFLQVLHGREKEFLWPLGIEKILGVGKQTEMKLRKLGLHSFKDIAHANPDFLEQNLGKWGAELWKKSQGIGSAVIDTEWEQKSMSRETTFHENISDEKVLLKTLVALTERVAYDIRQDGKIAGCIAIKIRFANFETITRQETIAYTALDDVLIGKIKNLFGKFYQKGTSIRLLGVKLSQLIESGMQTSLFDEEPEKLNLYKAVDAIKNKYGKSMVTKALIVKSKKKES